jgi:hypothetical protein
MAGKSSFLVDNIYELEYEHELEHRDCLVCARSTALREYLYNLPRHGTPSSPVSLSWQLIRNTTSKPFSKQHTLAMAYHERLKLLAEEARPQVVTALRYSPLCRGAVNLPHEAWTMTTCKLKSLRCRRTELLTRSLLAVSHYHDT